MSVCLSVRSHIAKTTRTNFTKFSVHAAGGLGSVLLGRQCDTLCTSGFCDDVMFSHNRENTQNQRRRLYSSSSLGGGRGQSLPYPTWLTFVLRSHTKNGGLASLASNPLVTVPILGSGLMYLSYINYITVYLSLYCLPLHGGPVRLRPVRETLCSCCTQLS